MTYFDFTDFYPVRYASNRSFNKINTLGTPKLIESPFHIEAPGFSKQDITAEVKNDDWLHIKASSSKYGERSFEQVIHITDNVDKKTIELSVENGMITVEFKHKEKESMSVKIK